MTVNTPTWRTRGGRQPSRRLSEDVAEQITNLVVSERLQPGDRLPTEPELVELYDVSRTVVREAGRLLVERGVVDIRPGRGMVVASFDGTSISRQWQLMLVREQGSFRELMEMRLALEVGMTEHAAERRNDSDLTRISAALEAFDSTTGHERSVEADLDFHAAVAAAAHNPFFLHVVNPINDYLREVYEPSLGYDHARQQTELEHHAIAQAIQVRDVPAAREASRTHLLRILNDSQKLVANDAPTRPARNTDDAEANQ